ncbi:La domain-containing protein [Rhizoctonia solani AG-1 IA]|uniref:La domain-containing protein n=1 Tax=Thanatephorus cucumeris (strain AG1-IA) TaxID=983506 RepID=L8WL39_THACA|nr:La domain-containing protein [Rhizoctonia solani AG-1 IA]
MITCMHALNFDLLSPLSLIMASAAVDTPMATEEERAVKQFEFYFSDANLPYDKFMWKLHTQTEDHWIPIATIASFKRMREFEPKGAEWLLSALRSSSSLLEIDETGTKARRAHELVEPKDQFERSVYAKGFPDETPDLQVRLEKFFSQFGKVNAVRMRRTEQKVFKNSVFVEFDDFSSVKAFLEADPKPTFEGAELVTMSKEAYCTMKIKEKGLDKKGVTARTHSGTGGAGGRKQFDAFQNLNGGKKEKEAVTVKFQGKVYTLDGEGKINVPVEEFEFEKGSAIRFTGAGSEDAKFGEIKSPLKEKFTPLPFIKMDKGATEGVFGFGKTLSEEEIAFLKEKVPKIGGGEVTWELLSEEDERTFHYWRLQDQAKRAHADAQQKGNQKGGRGGNRDKGGRPNNNRGRNDRDSKPRSRGADSKPRSKAEDATAKDEPVEALKAGKTRGEVEPSGESAGQGIRGASIPSVASTGAKRKAEAEGESPEKKAKVEE